MKKLFVLFLIPVFLLAGCGQMSDTEIFENNLKCQDYLSGFIEENTPVIATISNIGVFYSPRENSCLGYLEYNDIWKSGANTTRIYNSYSIYGLLGNTKKSSYTADWWSGELTCEKESDFKLEYGKYDCDYSNSEGKKLRLNEIEWLKK